MLWKFGRATVGCKYNPLHHVPCQSDVTAIAKIDGETLEVSSDTGYSEMFNNRLKMDKLTGSLTITNIRPEHSGFYILQISNNTGTKYRRFNVTVSAVTKSHSHVVWMSIAIVLLLMVAVWCLATGFKNWRNRNFLFGKLRSYNCCQFTGAQEPESMPKSVIEGEPVTLNTDRTELQRDDVIEWKFGGSVIAKISRAANKICQKTYDGADERFRNRLELDCKTGSLTITNTRTTDSGDYQLQIATNGKVELYRKFNVSVLDSSQNIPKESVESPLMSEERCSSSNMELELVCLESLISTVNHCRRLVWMRSEEALKCGTILSFCGFLLFVDGVFGAAEVSVSVSVMKGDSVTLHTTVSELQSDDIIEWMREDNVIIAEVKNNKYEIKNNNPTNDVPDRSFEGRLELDHKTGSLTIKNITSQHEGIYILDIGGRHLISKNFSVTVHDDVESLSVMEGDSVTLHTGVTKIQRDDVIRWFGDQGTLIAVLTC
ncbi:uncharacterized protein LOC107740751 [Sinocyclocheilus rhinocerous]|uniref:uncharacterized protein LOC107740751 n=1 Tax=Sinocyclocheilus rhinocerous TaxID=307959 RepID=UPI0007B82386|nr:PREDICTED: uncharacterized protein LOC107740751 [Sinocyclocheilus rhinocerous]